MPLKARHEKLHSNDILGMLFTSYERFATESLLNDLAVMVPSDKAAGEEYAWLGNAPGMREWIGERQLKALREFDFTIKNKEWETTLEIADDDMRFDKLNQVEARVDEVAQIAADHPIELISNLVVDGESALCYDGQYFYDTDHSEGDSGTQDNDIEVDVSEAPVEKAGTTTVPSPEIMSYSILKAIQQMYGFKNDQGKPINQYARRFMVHVPISFWQATLAGVRNDVFPSGANNTIKTSGLELIVRPDPLLTFTDKFAVHRLDGGSKPFIHQVARDIEFRSLDEKSEYFFFHKAHLFGADGKYNVGYGLWQHSVLVTLT